MSNTAFALPDRTLVLDRYRPLKPLGRGGSGSVWLSHDERTGLEVALKIVPREGKRAARASREMEAASRLRHERCVRAYDFGGDAGHVYIAYEYVRGRTLREAVGAEGLADAEAVEIAAQVLDGLAHAHRRGIVHRDVKPSNVLVEESEELSIRVLDFGLAQFDEADTLTAVGDVPGTLAYISPERLSGEEATERSDIWAVGVILWEALVGSHPFWGVPLPQVASTIASGAPPLSARRPDLPRRLLAAVDAALAVDATCGSGTPQKGWLPTSASQRITPTAHTSLRSLASLPPRRSGEMYASVPGTSPTAVSVSASSNWASPKSSTRADSASPSSTRTFDGFTSRWTIPRRWACASPSRICAASSTAVASSSSPLRISSRSVRPRTYSYAMYTWPSSAPKS